MIFCKELNLPAPPDSLIEYSLKVLNNETDIKNMQTGPSHLKTKMGETPKLYERYIDYMGENYRAANVERFPFNDSLLSWFESNIYEHIKKCNTYQLSSQLIKNGFILHPHTDGPRGPYVLSYLLDAGGNSVDTIWFKEAKQEILRDPGLGLLFFEDLEELFRFRVRPFTWTLMDARVLHAVVGMTRTRKMISVGLYPREYNLFLKQHLLENEFIDG